MKKLLSFFIASLLILSCSVVAFAANDVTFSVPDAETFAGDELTVDVFISDGSFLKSATVSVHFDGSKLTFLDLYVGAIVPGGDSALTFKKLGSGADSYIQIEYSDKSASLSSAGKFATLVFTAKDEAAGKSDIKLSAKSGAVITKYCTVQPVFDNGQITVINNTPVVTPTVSHPAGETDSTSDISQESAETQSSVNVNQSTGVSNNGNESITDKKPVNKSGGKSAFIIITFIVLLIIVVLIFIINGNLGKRKSRKRKSRRGKK